MKKRYVETNVVYFDNDKYYSKVLMGTDDYIDFINIKGLTTSLYTISHEDNITTYTRKNSLATETVKVWFE